MPSKSGTLFLFLSGTLHLQLFNLNVMYVGFGGLVKQVYEKIMRYTMRSLRVILPIDMGKDKRCII